ncbi:methyl-accepting chemotaxis sensory transducer [Desulforamulus reducens MI-1]|uniref:Methyl-accepting chemotaxis sensory transducer n=1 Tax=Desulforamulus reducens (strain ATCC BAA-1160 / DSM 100696 / MI-1) TaxID=349161 RepID=A4J1I0_DESRM|nr:methyl-accepting chemotaxis protein [Desulforamulus reducens]ABO48933.1 methyl-accepting chemotaxis sensory transducer [Desulforamulus reducens MI-1]
MNSQKLQVLSEVLETIKDIFPMDCMISLTDREKFLKYLPGDKIDVKVKAGDKLAQGDAIDASLSTGKKSEVMVPVEVFGYPFKAVALPVIENGEVIGSVGVGFDISAQEEVASVSETLAASTEEISSSVEEMAASAQQLTAMQTQLSAVAQETNSRLQKTDEILKFIKDIAGQTKLLGLNAAIEAARAGEAGRGFHVVADEIRKLSDRSAVSVKDIADIVHEIRNNTNKLLEFVEKTNQISEGQSEATQYIAKAIEENARLAENLSNVSKNML